MLSRSGSSGRAVSTVADMRFLIVSRLFEGKDEGGGRELARKGQGGGNPLSHWSTMSLNPGPPAGTYPWVAPAALEVTQKEYRLPFSTRKRISRGVPATARRSPPFQTTSARV